MNCLGTDMTHQGVVIDGEITLNSSLIIFTDLFNHAPLPNHALYSVPSSKMFNKLSRVLYATKINHRKPHENTLQYVLYTLTLATAAKLIFRYPSSSTITLLLFRMCCSLSRAVFAKQITGGLCAGQIVLPPSPPGLLRGQMKNGCDKKGRGTAK